MSGIKAMSLPRLQVVQGGAALLVTLLLAWWLAEPGSQARSWDELALMELPQITPRPEKAAIDAALETLYRRQLWSAQQHPSAAEGEQTELAEAETKPPEGLDRFRLLGVIQVSGQGAEALLLDSAADAEGLPFTLLAREQERLRGTQVRLAQINKTRVRLELAGEQRWLWLFPLPEDDPNSNTTNE